MRLLVFQHIDCEHPGSLRRFLAEDGVKWDVVRLQTGEQIPAMEFYDALWVMGGPMDVWDVDEHHWMAREKSAIRHWIKNLKRPFLGICLGHQLMADSLGGTCGPQVPPEIGFLEIELTKAGEVDPLFAGFPKKQIGLQWHGVRVAQPAEGSSVLASSPACRVQAVRYGQKAWSLQYHVEVEAETIKTWGEVPGYRKALEKNLGVGALDKLAADATKHLPRLEEDARRLYRNFRSASGL